MPKAIICNLNDRFLSCDAGHSDRFVYSNYFIPLSVNFRKSRIPIVPFYKKQVINDLLKYRVIDTARILPALSRLGLEGLLDQNSMKADPVPANAGRELDEALKIYTENQEIKTTLKDAKDILEIIATKVSSDLGLINVAKKKLEEVNSVVSSSYKSLSSGWASGKVPKELSKTTFTRKDSSTQEQIDFLLGLIKSDIGYLFLDRTRIRPEGFDIGEHVYGLGLAPGEEVVLEQKTFTKRQTTFEEQNEKEKQFDLELSSTLSTEIQEGFERQKNITDTWGLNLSHTGSYSTPKDLPWGSINASHTIGFTKNVTEANQESRKRSVKDSRTASSKVASKYRTVHKTSFKIATEQGFESTSKRTVKNPNRLTPITLHYFKVLRKLRMTHERYGVRLCWTPCVKDPAADLMNRIMQGRKDIIDTAKLALPDRPQEPQPSVPPISDSITPTVEAKIFWSGIVPADKWGLSGDMRADYDVDISYDSGYEWDNDVGVIEANLKLITDRPGPTEPGGASASIKGIPVQTAGEGGNVLRVKVHVGAKPWLGGPSISLQVGARFIKTPTLNQQVQEDTKYNDDLAGYRTALKDWNDKVELAMEQATREATEWEMNTLLNVEPVNEMIGRIIRDYFPPSVRDECWEIDLWQQMFEWERASYVSFPSWWSDQPIRDATKDPSDFINASWAKLYLPIKVGMERAALRWIYGKAVSTPLDDKLEEQFQTINDDLEDFRTANFGSSSEVVEAEEEDEHEDEDENEMLAENDDESGDDNMDADEEEECPEFEEKFRCLGKWTELLPTDGTHIEVIQGFTTAADRHTEKESEDAADLRQAIMENRKQDTKLKEKAYEKMTEAATIQVRVGVEYE